MRRHVHQTRAQIQRIRIDRESEAIHDLILSLDEPVGIRRGLYICKYLFLNVGRLQAGWGEYFSRGERDHVACREAKNRGIYVVKGGESSCDRVRGRFLPFRPVIPVPGKAG